MTVGPGVEAQQLSSVCLQLTEYRVVKVAGFVPIAWDLAQGHLLTRSGSGKGGRQTYRPDRRPAGG